MKLTNYNKLKEIDNIDTFAFLISGKYACKYCSFRGEICENSYMDNSCIEGIKLFLQSEYKNNKKTKH